MMSATKVFAVRRAVDADDTPALRAAIAAADAFASGVGLDPEDAARLRITVEELVDNALRHGGRGREMSIRLQFGLNDGALTLAMTDDGAAFDLRRAPIAERPDPVTGGGVGLSLVRAWWSVAYRREGDANRLELRMARAG